MKVARALHDKIVIRAWRTVGQRPKVRYDCQRGFTTKSLAAISGSILGGLLIDMTNHASIWLFSAFFMFLAFLTMLRLK